MNDLWALTYHRPWPTFIMRTDAGRKDCENRGQPPPRHLIGKRVAVHAGKKYGLGAWPFDGTPPADADCPGGIVGTVRILGALDKRDPNTPLVHMPGRVTIHRSQKCWRPEDEQLRARLAALDLSPWWAGPVGILVEEPIACAVVPCKGAQGWWRVPADVAAQVGA